MSGVRIAVLLIGVLWFVTPRAAWAVPDRGLETQAPEDLKQDKAEEEEAGPAYTIIPSRNPIPRHRLTYSFALFGRINPLGLISTFDLGYRGRLMDSDGLLFSDTYVFVGMSARASPAFGRVGGTFEISPIAVWKAWVTYEFVGYFGTFDQIQGFTTPTERYSDKTLANLPGVIQTIGSVLTLGTTLQAKLGPVAVRSTFSAVRFDLELEDGDRYFYDQFWDRLAPNKQFMFLNDLDVLGFVSNARIGARWTWSDGIMGNDNQGDAALAHHRFGPLFAWQFHDRGPGARWDTPTLFVLAQWWLQHPYRTGDEQPAGLPLIAIGLAFKGDLLGDKPPRRRGKGKRGG